jgi:hypothetical protein
LIDGRHDAFAGRVDAKVGSLISLNRAKDDTFLFLKELARHKLAGKQPMADLFHCSSKRNESLQSFMRL